jgi:hypothetical protein
MTWATSRAQDVAGMVLVDAPGAHFSGWYTSGMSAEERQAQPEVEGPEHLARSAWDSLADLPPQGAVPLVVLTHDPANPEGVEYTITDRDPEEVRSAWVEGQEQWEQTSSESELVTVDGAGHFIHLARPEAVEAAVLAMLDGSG